MEEDFLSSLFHPCRKTNFQYISYFWIMVFFILDVFCFLTWGGGGGGALKSLFSFNNIESPYYIGPTFIIYSTIMNLLIVLDQLLLFIFFAAFASKTTAKQLFPTSFFKETRKMPRHKLFLHQQSFMDQFVTKFRIDWGHLNQRYNDYMVSIVKKRH